jgi:hypothetical protein
MIGQREAPFFTTIFSGNACYYFGKYIRNAWKVLKGGAGEGWRRSIGLIV